MAYVLHSSSTEAGNHLPVSYQAAELLIRLQISTHLPGKSPIGPRSFESLFAWRSSNCGALSGRPSRTGLLRSRCSASERIIRKLLVDVNRNLIAVDFHKQNPDNVQMEQFKKMISELIGTGLTQKSVGDSLGKSQAWIGAILADKFNDLKWSDGEALRKLHAKVTAKVGISGPETTKKEAE